MAFILGTLSLVNNIHLKWTVLMMWVCRTAINHYDLRNNKDSRAPPWDCRWVLTSSNDKPKVKWKKVKTFNRFPYRHTQYRRLCVMTGSLNELPRSAKFDTDSFHIRIDSHSSYCVSNSIKDFIGPLTPIAARITGIGGAVKVTKMGTVRWKWEDDMGVPSTHVIKNTLFMPFSPDRILSPQHWSQEKAYDDSDEAFAVTDASCTKLSWNRGRSVKTVPLDKRTNVSTMRSLPRYTKAWKQFTNVISDDDDTSNDTEIEDDDDSESSVQRDSMNEHDTTTKSNEEMNLPIHIPLPLQPRPVTFTTESEQHAQLIEDDTRETEETVSPQQLYLLWHHRLNHMPHKRMMAMAKRRLLPRAILQVRPPRCAACLIGKATKTPWRTKATYQQGRLPQVNRPGDCISVDQLQSTTPGLIAQLRGFITKDRYLYATIFVDHASSLGFVYLQRTSNMEETLKAKDAFEKYSLQRGVVVQHYHADNGRFADKGWIDQVRAKGQTITFCGVNAHHQNGVAEKRIRDLQELARAALIHSFYRWPDAINAHLWPFALRSANHNMNNTPWLKDDSGQTPSELFSQLHEFIPSRHFHTFGCPAYVLDSPLQSGQKRTKHKWGDRAKVSVNLGPSPRHGRSVHLLLNTQTGMVTPQFHVKFDDSFDTTKKGSDVHLPSSLWQKKTYFTEATKDKSPSTDKPGAPSTSASEGAPVITPIAEEDGGGETEPPPQLPPPDEVVIDMPAEPPPERFTRSGRRTKMPERFNDMQLLMNVANYDGSNELQYQYLHPLLVYFGVIFKATTNPDIMYLDQALRAEDSHQFIKAMLKEVRTHERRNHWEVIPKTEVPSDRKVLPSVWAMARKREMLTGQVYKWKSRLNLGGHKQVIVIDYDLTYAPVIAWATLRLFFTFFILNDWATQQLDLVLAYPHAKVKRPTFMSIPRGFRFKGSTQKHVLRLIYNLYGAKDAGRTYYQFMVKYLKQLSFVQSAIDPCVFYYGDVILLIYVDDFIIAGRTVQSIADAFEVIADNIDIENKGAIADYVGIHVEREPGKVLLTQPHLIKSILKDLHLGTGSKTAPTPALSSVILHADMNGPDHDGHFNYRSLIGKLNYLEKSTRPDIGYAVHQCARFQSNPKESHAKAVKRIARYLLLTKEMGLILFPKIESSFECYVDASFSGEWVKGHEDQAMYDPNTARSRTGFIIRYANVPLVWQSKLQIEISLSSTEAEMIALSAATRENIYLIRLIHDINAKCQIKASMNHAKIRCRIFEDNQGTLAIAQEFRIRPRTKHINVKYWHFLSFINQHKGVLTMHWVPSSDQLADILTKPLGVELHNKFTHLLCGWKVPGGDPEA